MRPILSVALITLTAGWVSAAPTRTKVAAAATAAQQEAIIKLVQHSQRAGWLRHDLKGYLAPWAKKARLVIGRTGKPSRLDVVLPYRKLKQVRALRFRGRPLKSRTMEFSNVKLSFSSSSRALLSMRVKQRIPGGFETVEDHYKLRKTRAGWRIFHNRSWPVEVGFGDNPIRALRGGKQPPSQRVAYGPEIWKKLDDMVKRVRATKKLTLLARALLNAWRFTEAHQVMKRHTKKKIATGTDWALRGVTAAMAGDAADAIRSFKRAHQLDPKTAVPGYAKDLK
jgi:hypothetical protein